MKKLSAKQKLLLADVSLIPGLLLCRWLADLLLTKTNSVCSWTQLGGKCITCGGTHFVQSLLHFRIGEAFAHNEFLFVLSAFLLLSYVLLHLCVLWKVKFAEAVLKKVYSIPGLILGLALMLGFFLVRNIPVFLKMLEIIKDRI